MEYSVGLRSTHLCVVDVSSAVLHACEVASDATCVHGRDAGRDGSTMGGSEETREKVMSSRDKPGMTFPFFYSIKNA